MMSLGSVTLGKKNKKKYVLYLFHCQLCHYVGFILEFINAITYFLPTNNQQSPLVVVINISSSSSLISITFSQSVGSCLMFCNNLCKFSIKTHIVKYIFAYAHIIQDQNHNTKINFV